MKEARHKNAYGMIPYTYKILEKANKSIVMTSVSGEAGVKRRKNLSKVLEMFYILISVVV